jgi:hypothetical protein
MRMDVVLGSGVIVVGNAGESSVSRSSTSSEGMLPLQVETILQWMDGKGISIKQCQVKRDSVEIISSDHCFRRPSPSSFPNVLRRLLCACHLTSGFDKTRFSKMSQEKTLDDVTPYLSSLYSLCGTIGYRLVPAVQCIRSKNKNIQQAGFPDGHPL